MVTTAKKAKAPSLDNSSCYNFHCTKRNIPTNWPYDVDLRVWNDVILLYYAILLKRKTSNLRRYLYELNHTAESLEMTEEQCHRPSDGNKRKRITGWLAGHTIHLEIEEVSWIK